MIFNDSIFINAIKTRSVIGILPHERAAKQTLLIDCELFLAAPLPSDDDDITKTIDYAQVTDFIIKFSEDAQCKLIETFAEHLAAAILNTFSPAAVRLKISKPGALLATRDVGITIYRERIADCPPNDIF